MLIEFLAGCLFLAAATLYFGFPDLLRTPKAPYGPVTEHEILKAVTQPLAFEFTPAARRDLAQRVAGAECGAAVPALLLLETTDARRTEWVVRVYALAELVALSRIYVDACLPLLHKCNDLTLAIPQPDVLRILEGQTLDCAAAGFVLLLPEMSRRAAGWR